jgi:hypothetical protein
MDKFVTGIRAWILGIIAVLIAVAVLVSTQAWSAGVSVTAQPIQNSGPGGVLTYSQDWSAASNVVTRHESSDLTLNVSDQITSVSVQGTKASGAADVKVDLLDSSQTIVDTATVALDTAAGTYNQSVTMTGGTTKYVGVAKVLATYTATATGGAEVAIYREAAALDAITTASFDHDWDTVVSEDATAYNLNVDNKTIELQSGHYLVMYGSRFDSTGGSNRSDIQSQLVLAGADQPIGWSQGYIRRSGGADEAFTSGGGIIQVATDNDPLILRSFRTDNNSAGLVQRVPNTAGIQLLKLYDGWNVLRLSKATSQTGPTSTTFVDVTYDQQDEINATDFGHTSGQANITLKTPGHYIVFANTYGSIPVGTSTGFRTLITQKLTLDGGDIDGTRTSVYIRGNNSTSEGAVSIGTIIETTLANQILNVEVNLLDGSNPYTINQDDTGATVNRTAITIAKLGEGADYIRLDDSGTDDLNPAALTPLGWDTEDEKDTESFTHPAPAQADSTIAVAANDKYLFLTSNYAAAAGVTRGVYSQGWTLNGGALLPYGQTGNYVRSTAAPDLGNWSGIVFDSLSAGDYIEVETQALGAAGAIANDIKGVQGLRLRAP